MNDKAGEIEFVNIAPAYGEGNMGPGEMLREARFAADMSEDEVASQLRLPLHLIVDLENDDYHRITSVTFVRGYLRSYARLVHLSGDEVIERFHGLGFVEPEKQRASLAMAQQKKSVSHDKLMRYLTYLIVIVLASLVFIWWKNHNTSSTTIAEPDAAILKNANSETNTTASIAPHVTESNANVGDEDMVDETTQETKSAQTMPAEKSNDVTDSAVTPLSAITSTQPPSTAGGSPPASASSTTSRSQSGFPE